MTKEEAIKVIEDGDWWDSYITESTIEGINADDELHEALDLALAALRPVSRAQVDKVWRGEWINVTNYTVMGLFYGICSKCHEQSIVGAFCNKCGAPMTDEAVQMVMERLEELKDGNVE